MRHTGTVRDVFAGCFQCNGSEAIWRSKNAQGVAARHHDATGHITWVEVNMSIRYGEEKSFSPAPAKNAPLPR